MRVLLSLRNRRRDERGAVAVIVSVLAVTLLIMGAFVVDFGQAYVNKRQAQTAADAGALAAGQIYAEDNTGRACSALNADSALETAARNEADSILAANMPNNTITGTLDVSCVDDSTDPTCVPSVTCDQTLRVQYTVNAESPIGLGALATGSDHMNVERTAAVGFGKTQKSVGSLRPWMICGGQVPSVLPDKVVEIGYPGNGHKPPAAGSCGVDRGGDWWRTSCFNPDGKGGGSHGDTSTNVLVGCTSVQIVPGQPTGAAATPTALSTRLRDACAVKGTPGERPYCLGDDTGHDVKGLADEWDTLLGQTIAMPMFCDMPQCSPTSVSDNKKYNWPVYKIAAVTICGYALKGAWSSSTLPIGDCNNKNSDHLDPKAFSKDDTGFLVLFRGIIEAGGTGTFPVETKTTTRLIE